MGFCVFGAIGDCGSEASATVTQINESVSSVFNNMFTGQTNSSRAGAQVRNILELKSTGPLRIEGDISQENVVTVSLNSWQSMQNSTELTNALDQAIDNAMDVSVSASSDLFANPANSEMVSQITNIMKTEVQNNVTVDMVNECIATAAAENQIKMESADEIVIAETAKIGQKNVVNVSADCVMNQMNDIVGNNETVQKLVQDINANIEAEQQGLWNTISDIFGSFTTIAIIIGVVILVAIIGFLVFMFMRRRRAKKAVAKIPKQVKEVAKKTAKQVTKTTEQAAGYLYNMIGGAGKPSTMTIIGIVLGSLLILGIFIWIIWYFFIRKKSSSTCVCPTTVPGQEPGTTSCSELIAEWNDIRAQIAQLEGNPDNEGALRILRNQRDIIGNQILLQQCQVPRTTPTTNESETMSELPTDSESL